MTRARTRLVLVLVCGVFAALAIGTAMRRELWVDEIFSLAMATGHSLEHPAAVADPALGDFVEPPTAVSPVIFREYLETDAAPAGVSRVLRAVRLSDTSPPLYYIVLSAWSRLLGTSDLALRLFSIVCAVACVPLLALLARRLGGKRAWLPACLLFAFAPQSVYYASEGRMYSMFLLLVLAMMLLTLTLHRRGAALPIVLSWIVLSAAGLLTHYFFLFPWSAATLWLLLHPHRLARRYTIGSAAVVALLVAPWFVGLPRNMALWRVTKGWLELRPYGFSPVVAQVRLLWSYFDVDSSWVHKAAYANVFLLLTLAVGVGFALATGRRRFLSDRWQLLWLWLAAANLGLLAVDLLQHTYTRQVNRYALAGMPAAFLLVATALSRLPILAGRLLTAAIVVQWLPTYWVVFTRDVPTGPPFRAAAQAIAARSDSRDLVIVHSIPSGVLEIARYMRGAAPIASWVGELGTRRVPDDVVGLTTGRRRVFVVALHDMSMPRVEEAYLRAHATEVIDPALRAVSVSEFIMPPTNAAMSPVTIADGQTTIHSPTTRR